MIFVVIMLNGIIYLYYFSIIVLLYYYNINNFKILNIIKEKTITT